MNVWVDKASSVLNELTGDLKISSKNYYEFYDAICINLFNILEMMEIPIEELKRIGVAKMILSDRDDVQWNIFRTMDDGFYNYVMNVKAKQHKRSLRYSGNAYKGEYH